MSDKAVNAVERTQTLYELAQGANQIVLEELEPQLTWAKANVDDVSEKTKDTKQKLEKITK